ncbi:MAG: hypothetical protein DRH57_04655 [Candidatus Cloacimonadota bacterium]|nr:MAG: hypothetical protein DRH57_04655 [Candidatus Cloacimonadota bacterium]
MTKENKFVAELAKLYKVVDNNGGIRVMNDDSFEYIAYTAQKRELLCYSLTFGRLLIEQNTTGIKTELYYDSKYLKNTDTVKGFLDVAIKNANKEIGVIIENGIVPSTTERNLITQFNKKMAQALNYMLTFTSDAVDESLADTVYIQVCLYHPDSFFSTKSGYDTYMQASKNFVEDQKLFEKTGLFSKVIILSKSQIYSLQDNYNYGILPSDIANPDSLVSEILKSVETGTNIAIIEFNDVEHKDWSSRGDMSDVHINFDKTIKNAFTLENLPIRSSERGGSSNDNVRALNDEKVEILYDSMADTFHKITYDNPYIQLLDVEAVASAGNIGWHDRLLSGSKKLTTINVNKEGRNISVFTCDTALSNAQHNTIALLELKRFISKLDIVGLRKFLHKIEKDIRNWSDDTFLLFQHLIVVSQPKVYIRLFENSSESKSFVSINNAIRNQSKDEQLEYISKTKLSILCSALNFKYSDIHAYTATDASQNPLHKVVSKVSSFNITRLHYINNGYNKGRRIKKPTGSFITDSDWQFIKSISLFVNLSGRRYFTTANNLFKNGRRTNPTKAILDELYKDTTTLSSTAISFAKNEIVSQLEKNRNQFNKTHSISLLKIIKKHLKVLTLSTDDKKAVLNDSDPFIILLNMKAHMLEHNINYSVIYSIEELDGFIRELNDFGIVVDTTKLYRMIEIYNYNNSTTLGRSSFLRGDNYMAFISSIIGYKGDELTLENYKKYSALIDANLEAMDKESEGFDSTRMQQFKLDDLNSRDYSMIRHLFMNIIVIPIYKKYSSEKLMKEIDILDNERKHKKAVKKSIRRATNQQNTISVNVEDIDFISETLGLSK